MSKKNIVFVIICCLMVTSCKKGSSDLKPPPAELGFDLESLAYVQLNVGKYFIYKDSASGTTDSVVVTQSNVGKIFVPVYTSQNLFDPSRPAYSYQLFTLLLTKFTNTSPEQDWFYGVASNATPFAVTVSNPATPLSLLERDRNRNADKAYVFNYPITPYSTTVGSVSVSPSLVIEGKTYQNVIIKSTENGLDPTHPYYLKSTYYWVKGTGIIKREIRTNMSVKTELLVRNG